ncbi:MAG: cupin domain-containing protein [Clostridiales bacterium]|nr:cupin domain-containing protein [Clostridiales bacterium]
MIRRSNEMTVDVKEKMRGGEGTVNIKHIFLKDEMRGKVRLTGHIVLEPGSSIGLHEHVDEEELYYIIRGKGTVTDNGVTTEVAVGDAVLTGGGASHTIINNSTEPLEFIAIIFILQKLNECY